MMRVLRGMLWLLLGLSRLVGVLLLLVLLGGFWLLTTDSGGSWLLRQLPGVSVSGFQGQLITRWQADMLHWQQGDLSILLEQPSLSWQPGCLLHQRLCIRHISAASLQLTLADAPVAEQADGTLLPDLSATHLPDIQLPVAVALDHLQLGQLNINRQTYLRDLSLNASLIDHRLDITSLTLIFDLLSLPDPVALKLSGWLQLAADWPLELMLSSDLAQLDWQLDVQGALRQQLDIRLSEQQLLDMLLQAEVALFDPEFPVDISLQLADFDPRTATGLAAYLPFWPEPLVLHRLQLDLAGQRSSAWQLAADVQLLVDTASLQLQADAQIDDRQLVLHQLAISADADQSLQLSASSNWPVTELDLKLDWQQLLDAAALRQLLPALSELPALQEQVQAEVRYTAGQWQSSGNARAHWPAADEVMQWQTRWQLELPQALLDQVRDWQWPLQLDQLQALNNLLHQVQVNWVMQLQGGLALGQDRLQTRASSTLRWLGDQQTGDVSVRVDQLSYQQWQLEQLQLAAKLVPWAAGDTPLGVDLDVQQVLQRGEVLLQQLAVSLAGELQAHEVAAHLVYQQQPLDFVLQGQWQQADNNARHLGYQLLPVDLQQLAFLLPPALAWQGSLQAQLDIWLAEHWRIGLQLFSEQGQWLLDLLPTEESGEMPPPLQLDYDRLALNLAVTAATADLDWQLSSPQLGQNQLNARVDLQPDASGQRALEGEYQLQGIDLQWLQPFTGLQTLTGQLRGTGWIEGDLMQPRVSGQLYLSDISAASPDWPTSLQSLDAELQLQGQQLQIKGDFRTGETGTGSLQGWLDWQEQPHARLHLQGQAVDLRIEPLASLVVYPDLQMDWHARQLDIRGEVRVPSGRISMQSLPPSAVSVSRDVQVIGREETEAPLTVNTDLSIILGEDALLVDALGLKASLVGQLHLQGMDHLTGEVALQDGTYQSWGQNLQLRQARLLFAGPMTLPHVLIEAVRIVGEQLAGVRVSGRADAVTTELFSEPAVSDAETLSWILLGRPLQGEADANAMNTLVISMGLKGVAGLTSRLGDAVGLESLELSTQGQGADTRVEATGYLNQRLSVRYGVGLYNEVTRLAMRYELSRQVYIEAVSSLQSSLDIFWRFDYD